MATASQRLHEAFDEAHLPLKVAHSTAEFSSRRGQMSATSSFMMDIRKEKSKGKNEFAQKFVIHPGGASIDIVDTDAALRQLILKVNEGEEGVPSFITFETRQWNSTTRKFMTRMNKQEVQASSRRFLIGMDELHCFFAELPKNSRCDTIKHAHEALRPKELRNTSEYKRQGEWFLVPVHDSQLLQKLETIVSSHARRAEVLSSSVNTRALDGANTSTSAYYRNTGLRGGAGKWPGKGRPHVCSEVLHWNQMEFCRGSLQHPDHRTRSLSNWHRVFRNTEEATADVKGQSWVD
eukprot:ANDGO_05729.mRNA.1 hypothetical protein CAOG_03840